ncbi:MAG: hypothetical protein FJW39_22400 [Acidobacteria bacterium]|nr:hypothetical protein [Acidobacteriota bacterium]
MGALRAHGIARAAQDLDVVVDLPAMRVGELYRAVSREFHVDEEPMRLLHLVSGFTSRHPTGRDQLAHRRRVSTALLGGDPVEVNVISAEDITQISPPLKKAEWTARI